jgi:hypothetical protein
MGPTLEGYAVRTPRILWPSAFAYFCGGSGTWNHIWMLWDREILGEVVMSSAEEFQAYAEECLGWAKTARTDKERDIFLQMARAWMEAVHLSRDRPKPHRTSDGINVSNALAAAR